MLAAVEHETIFEKLTLSGLAGDLTLTECRTLANLMTERDLIDGEYLLREGERTDALFIVTSGALEAFKQIGDYEESLSVIGLGGLAGAMGFVDGQGHSADLRALGDTSVLVLTREDLESELVHNPQLVYKVMRGVVRHVHNIVRRMNDQFVQLTGYIHRQNARY